MTFKSACTCQSEMPSWRLLISLTPLPCHHAIFLRWHSLAACLCVWNAGWLPALPPWPVHQSLASLALTYLITDIHLVSEYVRRPLRSSTDRSLTVPRTHNRFGDRSFAVAGPRLWSSLPISLQQISSYGQFRRYLKNHLFGIWEITAQCDAWFSALYKYSYLLTYLLTSFTYYTLALPASRTLHFTAAP